MGNEVGGIDKADRAGYEKAWANQSARRTLNDEDKNLWAVARYTVRPYVYFDKILIAWSIVKGSPQVKDVLTVTALDASFQDGVWIKVRSKVSQRESLLTHAPRKLEGLSIFAWVPFFNELRFASSDWSDPAATKNLRLSACFKMQQRPDDVLQEGVDYLSELHVFREKFPQYANTRF
jgi:hypothetical protein